MRMSAVFGVKNFGFFEIYGVPTRTRGEGDQYFAILCDPSLWTAYTVFIKGALNPNFLNLTTEENFSSKKCFGPIS